jgi:hypothetical protein
VGGGAGGGIGSGSGAGAGAGTSGGAGAGAGAGAGTTGGAGAGAGTTGGAGASASSGAGGTPGGQGQAAGSAETEAPARTPGEKRADIDRQLDASLGEFDEQLRKEQQRTADQRDSRAANNAGGEVPDTETGEPESDEGREELVRNRAGDLRSEGARDAARNGQGSAEGEGAGGSAPVGGGGVAARAIPSGEDDDIIARRLRKAAENETDPELKEKLWQEYIDYKENTQSG